MLILSGSVNGMIELRDITEEEFSELPRISTLGMNKQIYNSLLRIFTDNTNLLLCAVWVDYSLSELFNRKDAFTITGDNAFAIYEKLQAYNETYVVHPSEINYNHLHEFTLNIVPLNKLKLPDDSLTITQFRKTFIDNLLKEL